MARRPRDISDPTIERLLDAQDWDRLTSLFPPSSRSPDQALALLREHCRRLLVWNRSVSNLISKNDEARIVARHVAESLAPARWIAECGIESWLDLGSGAGFPAIPLVITGIGERWTLVESRRPKTLFLRKTVSEIGLSGVTIEVAAARLESLEWSSPLVGGFTARATVGLSSTLGMASRFVSTGGSAFLWKGSRWRDEIADDRAWSEQWRLVEHRPVSGTTIIVARFDKL